MTEVPDFPITSNEVVSAAFIAKGIGSFAKAVGFIKNLPYGRNADKENLLTLFSDNCGTCSTKHAILRQLAIENGYDDIKLMLGIFNMTAKNTPKITATLVEYQLPYLPEAHNYLKYNGAIIDCTFPQAKGENFSGDLMVEIEITPQQVTDYKTHYHMAYLQKWLNDNPAIPHTMETLWQAREACIKALSA